MSLTLIMHLDGVITGYSEKSYDDLFSDPQDRLTIVSCNKCKICNRKNCSICNKEKEDKKRGYCRACCAAYTKRWRQNKKEALNSKGL